MENDGLVAMKVTVPYQGSEAAREGEMVEKDAIIRVTPQRADELEHRYKVAKRVTERAAAAAEENATTHAAAKRGR